MISFTRFLLNPQKRGGRKLLTNPQAMHAAVLASFPADMENGPARVLWRVDHSGHEHVLYVVGPEEIDPQVIDEQAGWPSRPAQSADYRPLLDGLLKGHARAFRLTANPVRSLPPAPGEKRGKVLPHVTPAQQVAWLAEKAPQHGFEILRRGNGVDGDGLEVIVDQRKDAQFSRHDPDSGRTGRVALRMARFDGQLRVTDVDTFRETLTRGFGRGKAYGCGLITLARIGG